MEPVSVDHLIPLLPSVDCYICVSSHTNDSKIYRCRPEQFEGQLKELIRKETADYGSGGYYTIRSYELKINCHSYSCYRCITCNTLIPHAVTEDLDRLGYTSYIPVGTVTKAAQ